MRGIIYKAVEDVSKEEILNALEFREDKSCGTVFSFEEFLKEVEDMSLMDYDGSGNMILNGKVVKNSSTWIHDRSMYIVNKYFVPFEKLEELFGEEIEILWFNK